MMLSNYPWMGDEMQDDDLAEELRNSYDRGVHGAPRPSPYINERIFIELMDRLLPQLPEEERKIGDDGELVVPEFLLNAIAAEFHDYGGERDLREKSVTFFLSYLGLKFFFACLTKVGILGRFLQAFYQY